MLASQLAAKHCFVSKSTYAAYCTHSVSTPTVLDKASIHDTLTLHDVSAVHYTPTMPYMCQQHLCVSFRIGMFGIDLADYPKVKQFAEEFGNNQKVKAARKKMQAASK